MKMDASRKYPSFLERRQNTKPTRRCQNIIKCTTKFTFYIASVVTMDLIYVKRNVATCYFVYAKL